MSQNQLYSCGIFLGKKNFTKFSSMCQNIFEFEIMGKGEKRRSAERNKHSKKFSKEEANFVPKMKALCHLANLIIY